VAATAAVVAAAGVLAAEQAAAATTAADAGPLRAARYGMTAVCVHCDAVGWGCLSAISGHGSKQRDSALDVMASAGARGVCVRHGLGEACRPQRQWGGGAGGGRRRGGRGIASGADTDACAGAAAAMNVDLDGAPCASACGGCRGAFGGRRGRESSGGRASLLAPHCRKTPCWTGGEEDVLTARTTPESKG